MAKIKVVVAGASGRMGREVVKLILTDSEFELVGTVDKLYLGKDIGLILGRIRWELKFKQIWRR